ncbi:MAG: hypothetical protein ACRDGI_02975 [Candidatus Limnocylindrales bacterium]
MHRFLRAGSIGLIGAVIVLAGCSAGTPAAGSSSGPAGGASSVAPGSSTGEGGTSASCKALTAAEAQPLVVDKVTDVTITPFGLDNSGQECRFNTTEDADSVDVIVVGGDAGAAQYDGDLQGFASPAPLPGVGDKAMWDSNDESGSFVSMKGGIYCSVNVDAENVPGVGHLMDEVNNTIRIGDANYLILAAAAAALCNRIYGSGNTTIDLSGLSTPPSIAP